MTIHWYVLRSKPNKEGFLARQLESHGVEAFYPQLHVSPVNPRARKTRPYFPGYMFIHVDLEVVNHSVLQWMPGATGLVSFDGESASVPESLISTLKKQIEQINASAKNFEEMLDSGDLVLIQDGPFAGYEAIFDVRLSGSDRVRVLMNFLQKRQVPIDLNIKQIRRANSR